jgi:hypothetical protein
MSRTTSSNHGGPIGLDKSDAWRKATVSQRSNAIAFSFGHFQGDERKTEQKNGGK